MVKELVRSQDFGLGGGGTRPMPPSRFSVKPTRFGGEGGSSGNFRSFLRRTRFGVCGGGVVAEFVPVPAGEDQSNYLNSGNFFYISGGPGHSRKFRETWQVCLHIQTT